jgi:hypothetical protein
LKERLLESAWFAMSIPFRQQEPELAALKMALKEKGAAFFAIASGWCGTRPCPVPVN